MTTPFHNFLRRAFKQTVGHIPQVTPTDRTQIENLVDILVNLESMVEAALEIKLNYILDPEDKLLLDGVVQAGRDIAHRLAPVSRNHSDKPVTILYPELEQDAL